MEGKNAEGLKPEGEARAEAPGRQGGLSQVAQTDWVLGVFPKGPAQQEHAESKEEAGEDPGRARSLGAISAHGRPCPRPEVPGP